MNGFFFLLGIELVTCLTSHSWATEKLVPLSLPSFHWWNHTANNSRNTNFIYFSWLNFQSDPLHFIGNIFVSTLWLTQIQIGLINYNITTISILYCNWDKKNENHSTSSKIFSFFQSQPKVLLCCVSIRNDDFVFMSRFVRWCWTACIKRTNCQTNV